MGSPSMRSRQRAPKRGARLLVHRKLAPRQQSHLRHRIEAALAVRIEGADRIDFVAEQVDAIRHRRAHREQVDQPTAHGVFAGRDHLAYVAVAGEGELRLQRRLVELLLLREVKGIAGEEARRREAHECGRGRHQHHVDLALPDAPERGEPLGDQVLVRREGVVGQGLPVGEDGDAQRRREEGEFVLQALRVRRFGGENRHQPAAALLVLGEAREQERIGRPRRARQRVSFSGSDDGERHEALKISASAPVREMGLYEGVVRGQRERVSPTGRLRSTCGRCPSSGHLDVAAGAARVCADRAWISTARVSYTAPAHAPRLRRLSRLAAVRRQWLARLS